MVHQVHGRQRGRRQHRAQVRDVGGTAGDHRVRVPQPRRQCPRRCLHQVAGVRGDAERQPGEPGGQGADQGRVVREVRVQVGRRARPRSPDGEVLRQRGDLHRVQPAPPCRCAGVAADEPRAAQGVGGGGEVAARVPRQHGGVVADPAADGGRVEQQYRRADLADLRLDQLLAGPGQRDHDQLHPTPLEGEDLLDHECLRQPRPAAHQVDHPSRHRSPLCRARAAVAARRSGEVPRSGPLPPAHCLAILSHV